MLDLRVDPLLGTHWFLVSSIRSFCVSVLSYTEPLLDSTTLSIEFKEFPPDQPPFRSHGLSLRHNQPLRRWSSEPLKDPVHQPTHLHDSIDPTRFDES